MQLVKVGARYINLDNIYQVTFDESHQNEQLVATLDVVVPISMFQDADEAITGPIETASVHIMGRPAEALRYWLEKNSDNADWTYDNYLENQARMKQQEERERKFQELTDGKGLNSEAKYSYRYWLQNQEETADSEPREETFAAWQAWHIAKFEEAVKTTVNAAAIPADRIEEFKEYCKETGNYQPQYYDGMNFLRGDRATDPLPLF